MLNNKKLPSEEIVTTEKEDINPVAETITEDIIPVETEIIHAENHSQQSEVAEAAVDP